MSYLSCPLCRGAVQQRADQASCLSCGTSFPVSAGIPDLRMFGPLEGTLHGDLQDALELDSLSHGASFHQLVTANAELAKATGARSQGLIDYYTRMSLAAEQREVNRFRELNYLIGKLRLPAPALECALDVGTGMGPALPFLAERFKKVIAVDISLKHLVMARKRCEERGVGNVTFVCACAERLPLPPGICSLVNSADVLEHVADSKLFLKEVERVLLPGGLFWASAPNRFTILPEGHVKLWGVGLLPRRLQKPYVRIMRNTAYDGIRPVSYLELRRTLAAFFRDFTIVLPIDMHEVLEPHPGVNPGALWKTAKAYWRFANRSSLLRAAGVALEKTFYPQFRVVARKGRAEARHLPPN